MLAARKRPDFAEAEKLARQILKENFIIEPPVFATKLAEACGLSVFEAEFKPDYAHIAGFIDFAKNKILVNTLDSPARKNFTIAHELGHYLLGHNAENGYTVLLRNTDEMIKTPQEQEANCFAANLLVPEPFLREYLEKYPFATDPQLANIFGVSADVIRYRRLYL